MIDRLCLERIERSHIKIKYFPVLMAPSLDLQAFIVRARVLKLYRQALRTARKAPAHTRGTGI